MEPRQGIEELMLALNEISYDDEDAFEQYLSRLRETVSALFGRHHPYATCLGYLGFRSSGRLLSVEENVRGWANAKREIRALLGVILQDALLGCGQPVTFDDLSFQEDVDPSGENPPEALDIEVASSAHPEMATMSRVRIDLRDLFIMQKGSERFYKKNYSAAQDPCQTVLVLLSGDDILNDKVVSFLLEADARVIKAGGGFGNPSVQERINEYPGIASAVVVLADDCSMCHKADDGQRTFLAPSLLSCFEFGLLVGKMGRQRVLAVYEEDVSFRKPTGFFDALYVVVDDQDCWKDEVALRLGISRKVSRPGVVNDLC